MPWTLVFSLVVFAPLAGINIYIGRAIYKALTQLTTWNPIVVRSVVAGVLTFLNLLPVTFLAAYLIAGRRAVPAFAGDVRAIDLLLTYPFWIALIISVQLFILFGLLDVSGYVLKRTALSAYAAWSRRVPWIIVSVSIFVTVYSGAVVIRDTWTVRVVEREAPLPARFKHLSGFRIVQISDVQGDGRTTPAILRSYVERVNALKPDLVFFAGDLVTSGTGYIDSTAAILGVLQARYGTIAAVGDHDIFSKKSMVLAALRRAGIAVVEDTTLVLSVDSTAISTTVITYTYSQRPAAGWVEHLVSNSPDGYRIMLVHQPAESLVHLAAKAGYQLFIAGHTHGGGISFGVPGFFLWAPANAESQYVSGIYHSGDLIISVTNGLGFTLAPIRFHAPAEIVLITLR